MDREHRQPAHPALRQTIYTSPIRHRKIPAPPPEEAYVQAQKALIMLSSSLNKGIEKVESVQEATGKIQEDVKRTIKPIK